MVGGVGKRERGLVKTHGRTAAALWGLGGGEHFPYLFFAESLSHCPRTTNVIVQLVEIDGKLMLSNMGVSFTVRNLIYGIEV